MNEKIILLLLIIGLVGCYSYQERKWETFEGQGISIEDSNFSTLNFLNDSTGYLGGRVSKYHVKKDGTIKSQSHTTVLYRTQNKGRNWEKLGLMESGEIKKVKFHKNDLFVLSQSIYDSSSIYQSSDNGKHFSQIVSFPDTWYIRDFGFSISGELIVAVDNKRVLNLIKYDDEIDTLATLPRVHYEVSVGLNKIYLLNPSGGAKSNGVTVFDLESKSYQIEKFGFEGFVTSTYLTPNQEYWITLRENDEGGCLLKLTNSGFKKIELGIYKNYSPNSVRISGNLIIVDANRKEAVGPIGITHELLISNDNGVTWNLESYPFSLIVKPFDILPNGQYMAYQGMGEFQFRR